MNLSKLTKMYCKAKNTGKDELSHPYYNLPAQTSVALLRTLEQNWKSFFALCKNKDLKARPKPPKYKHKGDRYTYSFTNQQIKKNSSNVVILTKLLNIELDIPSKNIQQIEVKPKQGYLLLNAIYREEVEDKLPNEAPIN